MYRIHAWLWSRSVTVRSTATRPAGELHSRSAGHGHELRQNRRFASSFRVRMQNLSNILFKLLCLFFKGVLVNLYCFKWPITFFFTSANLFFYCSSSAKLCFSLFCMPTVKPLFEINKIDINPEKETSKPVYNQNKGTEENKAWHHKHSPNSCPSQRPKILQCPFSLLAHTLYPPTNTQTGLLYS